MHEQVGATTEQLRDDIDRGRTADKVAAAVAMASLETDEERGGTPLSPELIAAAFV
jgi:hypothetical protein